MRDEQDRDDHSKNGRSRKRKRQPENWKQNIRKRKRQAGSEYIGYKGETKRKRDMKLSQKDCNGSCKFKCTNKYSEDDRTNVFNTFWSYNDSENNAFYGKNVVRLDMIEVTYHF